MTSTNPETAPVLNYLLTQLWMAGLLLAVELQVWMTLRMANPGGAYVRAAGYAATMTRLLWRAAGGALTRRRRRA